MRRLIHISDLHFGRVREGIVDALTSDIRAFNPHMVVVTGDLTQRAKAHQFELATDFLRSLGLPYLVVPGNHDIAPLYRPFKRLLNPYAAYRRYVSPELNTVFSDDKLLLLGLNTVDPTRWKEGTVSRKQLLWILDQSRRHPEHFRVVAAHHPLADTLPDSPVRKVRRHSELLDTLEEAGVSLCLTGHLHRSVFAPFASAPGEAHVTLVLRASTATSTRVRDHTNAYNRIVIDQHRLDIRVRAWTGQGFETDHIEHFLERAGRWEAGIIELRGQPSMRRALP